MNNIFYAPPSDFNAELTVEIQSQEALHISKVLRHKVGDIITVADGIGSHFEVEIIEISKKSVTGKITEKKSEDLPNFRKVMAFGVIKKRDRLEFALEKAVELGASEICLFNADHSERSNINEERLYTQIISAFKQCGSFWLPKLVVLNSLDEVYWHYREAAFIMAHEEIDVSNQPKSLKSPQTILLVGPEGGFSNREVSLNKEKNGEFISLGPLRLRAETAVTAFLSQYLFIS